MPVSDITSYAASGAAATHLALNQPLKTTKISAAKAYHVTLTTEAKAKSLKLEGYTVSMISSKLGLDSKTIDQYLGISVETNNVVFKTTYSSQKSSYTSSKPNNAAPKAS